MSRQRNRTGSIVERLARKTRRPELASGPGRRRFLASAGSLLALPALELFHLEEAHSQQGGNGPTPLRLVVYFLPNGRLPQLWLPSATGRDFALPEGSAALEPFKSDLVFFSGLKNASVRSSDKGAGDHARACAGVVSCRTLPNMLSLDHDITSVDQLLVKKLAPDTRFRSLQYSAGEPFSCDRGASCAFTQSISWAGRGQPLSAVADPLSAFGQLFSGAEGDTPAQQQIRQASLTSVLDYTKVEATSFSQSLGAGDRAKFEEYQQSVRDVERQLTRTSEGCNVSAAPGAALSYPERLDAFHDIISLALQCDQTRFISFMLEYGLSSRSHPDIGAPGGHHGISHYGNDDELQQLIKLETWQGQQVGKFVQKIADTKEADGASMLDNTVILVLPSMGHGDKHDHNDVSPVLVGKAGGALVGGQYQKLKDHSVGDMYVTLMQAFGVQSEFGSDGKSVISGVVA